MGRPPALIGIAAAAALAGGCTAPAPAPDPERTTLPPRRGV